MTVFDRNWLTDENYSYWWWGCLLIFLTDNNSKGRHRHLKKIDYVYVTLSYCLYICFLYMSCLDETIWRQFEDVLKMSCVHGVILFIFIEFSENQTKRVLFVVMLIPIKIMFFGHSSTMLRHKWRDQSLSSVFLGGRDSNYLCI